MKIRLQLLRCWIGIVGLSMLLCGTSGANAQLQRPKQELDAMTASFDQAVNELVCFNFRDSYQMFDVLLDKLSSSDPLYYKSVLAKANCAQHITPPTKAMIDQAYQMYHDVILYSANTALIQRALISQGRIWELRDYPGDQINLPEAVSKYQQVIKRWPDQIVADEAALWLAGTYFQQYDNKTVVKQGIAFLHKWLTGRPENIYASAMWLAMAEVHRFTLKQDTQALDCYLKADEMGLPVDSQVGAVYWSIASLAEQLPDRLTVAVRYYQKIIRQTPTSGRAFEAQLALRRLERVMHFCLDVR